MFRETRARCQTVVVRRYHPTGVRSTVEGTLLNSAIHVSTIRKLTSIGLESGRKAPAFSLSDQFGRPQDLDTVKGPKVPFFSSSVRRTGDPMAKGNWLSCKALKL